MNEHQLPNLGMRLAELMASLSLAIDLGMGQPMEWVLKACWLGARLGDLLKLSEAERRDIYYLILLRHIGCTATATADAQLLGDELTGGRVFPLMDEAQMGPAMRFIFNELGNDLPPLNRARLVAGFFINGPHAGKQATLAHCEVAARFAAVLGFSPAFQQSVWHSFERWDGGGQPEQLKGDQIAISARVAYFSLDMIFYYMLMGGAEAALNLAQQRNKRFYDPALVDAFMQTAPDWFAQLDTLNIWQAVLDAEPGRAIWLSGEQLDQALVVLADFSDLKAPSFLEHSRNVSDLAARAAEIYGLPASDQKIIGRASLLHDIGKVGISARLWNKAGPLDDLEWEKVRLHPYYTERVFARSSTLEPLGALAAMHHERPDGSGYHRRLPGMLLPVQARVLAAANAYCARIENRPHRPSLPPESVADELRREAHQDRLDSDAVNAVLSAAGHRIPTSKRPKLPADLSPRELEVLRFIAGGLSNRQMAGKLVLSEKTIGRHVERLYDKIGVSTRAAATLFAVQNGLLAPSEDS